jgi:hypothetical protein
MVSFSGPALLTGKLVLRGVRLIRPHLHVLHSTQGGFALGLGEEVDADAAAIADRAVADALKAGKRGGEVGGGVAGLERVEIDDGDLRFDDSTSDAHWHAPRLNLLILKSEAGVSFMLRGPLETGGTGKETAEPATVSLSGLYMPATATASATVHWTGLRPASFARLAPGLALLGRADLATAGTMDLRYSQADGITDVAADVTGGAGTIDAMPWGAALNVSAVSIKGRLSDKLDRLALDDARIDLGGPKFALAGTATGLGAVPHFDLTARADEVPVDKIKTLWPASFAPNPRRWITTNMSGGAIHRADLKLVASVPLSGPGEAQVQSLSGSMQGDGITVHYLGALPPVHGTAAAATFDKDSMTIAVKGGVAAGVKVRDGTIKLTGLSADQSAAAFDLNFEAPVPEALKLIDAKPLGYANALGFDPAHAKGDATIALAMSFPLIDNLRLSQVKMKVQAQTKGLAIPKAALGLDLAEGNFDIGVDPHGMDVTGEAKLGTIPIDLKWHENFVPAAYSSRYEVKAILDAAGRKAVGLEDAAFQAPVIDGAVPVKAVATMMPGGKGDVSVKADLTPVAMRLPGLNWAKPAGEPAAAEAALKLNANGVVGVPRFALTGPGGLNVAGEMAFDTAGHPRRIVLSTAKWGRTDLKGTVLFKPDGSLGIDMAGGSFDASELVGGGKGERHLETGQPSLSVSARLGRVWLSDEGSISDVTANLARGPKHWRTIHVTGELEKKQSLRVDVRPSDDRHRSLKVVATDAGATFAAFGLFDNMRGGTLTVDGTYDDSDARDALTGVAKISGYNVVKAPLLARVLTIASLTGTLGLLSGNGIRFDQADIPFTLDDGILTLKDAHSAGTELGITADGQVDLDHGNLAIQGVIVPAYAINSAVGKIPLIGDLLTGGKGGGLIAFSYSLKGPSSDPSVSVNPLSALTPGFLRGLFDVFDSGSGTKVDRGTGTDKAGGGSEPKTPSQDGGDRQ